MIFNGDTGVAVVFLSSRSILVVLNVYLSDVEGPYICLHASLCVIAHAGCAGAIIRGIRDVHCIWCLDVPC